MLPSTRLSELISRWADCRKQGQTVAAEELCRDCPELLDELKRQIENLEAFLESTVHPPSQATPEPKPPAEPQAGPAQTAPPQLAGARTPVAAPVPETGVRPPGEITLQAGAEPVPGYRLSKRLGKGGFGEVWQALGPGGFSVAMKFVRLGEDAGPVELRSLELMKEIRHANLLALFGAWKIDDFLIVAMELAEQTLLDRFRAAAHEEAAGIPYAELIEYFLEAAKGIDFLNEPRHALGAKQRVGVQHRDIKPQNLLLVGGSVKVADFGLARFLEHSLTSHTGSMTPAYAPPEFFQGHTSDHSDQYSLAVTYCYLRGGRLPFVGNGAQIMAGHLTRPPDLTMLPEQERPAVARALAKDPQERWPSCRAFVETLRQRPPSAVSAEPPAAPARSLPSVSAVGQVTPVLSGSHDETTRRAAARTGPASRPRAGRQVAGGVLVALLLTTLLALWYAGLFAPIASVEPESTPPVVTAKGALKLVVPQRVALKAGGKQTFEIKVERQAQDGPVQVSCADLPDKVVLPPLTIPAGKDTASVTVEAGPAARVGEIPIRLSARGDTAQAEARLLIVVEKLPSLSLSLPETLELQPGEKKAFAVKVQRDGVPGPVEVSFPDLPKGITAQSFFIAAAEDEGRVELAAATDVGQVLKKINVEAISGSTGAKGSLTIVVKAPVVADLIVKGNALLDKKQYDQALAQFSEALKRDPKSALAYNGRGKAFLGKNDHDSALADFERAVQMQSDSVEFLSNRGRARAWLGEIQDALADFTRALQLDPRHAETYIHRASLRYYSADYAEALVDCNTALQVDSRCVEAYEWRAVIFNQLEDYDQEIIEADKALALDPKFAVAHFWRGLAYYKKKDFDKAIENFQAAVAADPKHDSSYYFVLHLYVEKGQTDKAIAYFTALIQKAPENAIAHVYRGMAYKKNEDVDRAFDDFLEAIRKGPDKPGGYRELAYLIDDKQRDKIIGAFKQIILANPDNPLVYEWRANCYEPPRGTDCDKAIADYTAALRLQPRDYLLYVWRARVHMKNKDYEKALADFSELIRLRPKSALRYKWRAEDYYFAKEDFDGAINDYSEAIRLEPKKAEYYRDRAKAYEKKGDAARAQADRDKVKELEEHNDSIRRFVKDPGRVIGDLDSASFEVRQAAETALEKLGKRAEPPLREALKGKLSLEARRRIEQLLEKLDKAPGKG